MDEFHTGMLLAALALLILLSAFFSGSETALMTLNRYRLRHLANEGHRGARLAQKLLERPDRLIGLILLGNNFVNILASAIATVLAMNLYGEPGIAIATGLLTLVILIFAEVTPKTLATRRPETVAFAASYIYTPLLKVMYPLVWLINLITNTLLRLLGAKDDSVSDDALSNEELRTVLAESGKHIPEKHVEMLLNILDLEHATVNDLMVPRNEIYAVDLDDPWDEIFDKISNSPHGRVIAFRESIDEVAGIVQLRKVFRPSNEAVITQADLESKIIEPYYVPEHTPLTVQLLNFQREKRRQALVVDEYGDILGLVTIEDILEEIVGAFTDDGHAAQPEIQPQPDGTWLIDGATPIRTLNREFNWRLSTDGPKTLNGLIIEQLESLPEVGAKVGLNGHQFEVIELEGNQVDTARLSLGEEANDEALDDLDTTKP
ncbi:MAG: HlyC/CorC family transporter [Granulosicoccaceae bacterium]